MPEPTSSDTSKVVRTAAASGAVLTLGAALVGQAGPVAAGPPPPLNVTTTGDDGAGSLRVAIEAANAAGGADSITFAAGLGTIELDTQIVITDELTITGPATISGGDATR